MTKYLYIPIALLFAASQQCSAMEKLSPSKENFLPLSMDAKILHTKTAHLGLSAHTSQVAKPTSVFCSKEHENSVTVFGKNCYGKDIYTLNDLERNTHVVHYYLPNQELARLKATKKNSLEYLANINPYKEKTIGAALHPSGFIAAFLHYTGKRILYWN